ncbi:hypothetical protein YC2023_114808 [Brassica napus]
MRRLEIDHTKNITLSSSVTQVKLPIKERFVCSSSFDDLVCLLHHWDVPILAPNFLRDRVYTHYLRMDSVKIDSVAPTNQFGYITLKSLTMLQLHVKFSILAPTLGGMSLLHPLVRLLMSSLLYMNM